MKPLFTEITTDKEADITGGAFLFNIGVVQANENYSPALSLAFGGGSGFPYYSGGAYAHSYTGTSQSNNIFVG